MIWIAIAAQLTAPVPRESNWFPPKYVPTKLLTRNVVQELRLSFTVTPAGKVQDCTVLAGNANPKVVSYTCAVSRRRLKFHPALDGNGNPAYGIFRTNISLWVGDGRPPKQLEMPDLDAAVSGLPVIPRLPKTVRLKFAVDSAGRQSDCEAETKKDDPVLAQFGCEQLFRSYRAPVANTPDGAPVASIQTATVLLRAK